MKQSFIYLILILLIFLSACSKKNSLDILSETHEALSLLKTVEYKVDYKAEYNNSELKFDETGKAYFDFTHKDSLLNTKYHFTYNNHKNSETVFNGSQFINTNWEDSTLFALKILQNENYKKTISSPFFISCSYAFLKEAFRQLIDSNLVSNDNCILSNVIVNGKEYYKLEFTIKGYGFWYTELIKNNKPEFFTKLDIVVDKKDFLPREIFLTNSKKSFFSQSNISEIKVNKVYPDSVWNVNNFPAELRRIDPLKQNPLIPKGKNAPNWTLPTLKLDSLTLKDIEGKLILLNFWSTGCGGCIKSIPTLNSIYSKYSDNGFEIIGITSNEKKTDRIEHLVEKYKMNFPIAWKGETIEKFYNVWAHPTFYLLDKKGRVLYAHVGFSETSFEEIEKLIKENI